MTETLVRRIPRYVYLCDAKTPDVPAAQFGWRLVAANNRPLGRCARTNRLPARVARSSAAG